MRRIQHGVQPDTGVQPHLAAQVFQVLVDSGQPLHQQFVELGTLVLRQAALQQAALGVQRDVLVNQRAPDRVVLAPCIGHQGRDLLASERLRVGGQRHHRA